MKDFHAFLIVAVLLVMNAAQQCAAGDIVRAIRDKCPPVSR